MFLFAAGEAEFYFYKVPFEVRVQGDECGTLAQGPHEAFYFVMFQEEFACGVHGIVGGDIQGLVSGDLGAHEEHFAAANYGAASGEPHPFGLYAFYFVPFECDARLERFEDFVIKTGPPIFGEASTFVFCKQFHIESISILLSACDIGEYAAVQGATTKVYADTPRRSDAEMTHIRHIPKGCRSFCCILRCSSELCHRH